MALHEGIIFKTLLGLTTCRDMVHNNIKQLKYRHLVPETILINNETSNQDTNTAQSVLLLVRPLYSKKKKKLYNKKIYNQ